jgi:hypothetical protein
MTFGRWEISSIQIYLYCTCIDTLAGKQDYMEFYQWLKTKNLSNLDKDKIDEYHEEYLDDYGDRRSFSKLFLNLPPSVKSWLNQNISIQQSNVYEVVESRNETELVRRLIDYFYKSWRNPFTHQSVTRPVEFIDGINSLDEHYSRIGISDLAKREWFCQPDSFHIGNENIKWHLWHRKEIDPAFILKIIIQSVVFQWLDINVTEELVTKIVYRFNRLYWMYAYIHEIRGNAEYIDLWRDINEEYSPKIVSNLRSFGVPQLSSTASSKILELFRADNVMEKSLREHIQGYIKCVTNINILIADLNKEYPRIIKRKRKLLRFMAHSNSLIHIQSCLELATIQSKTDGNV